MKHTFNGREKYTPQIDPDITEEEEKVSLPLQTLCGAIFDAILVVSINMKVTSYYKLSAARRNI